MLIDFSRGSPNFEPRQGRPVTLAVVHATVGGLAGSLSWLCSAESKVSAHYVISKTGAIFCLVPLRYAAWHAGKSAWRALDSEGVKLQSIGIELENLTGAKDFEGQDLYPDAQVQALTDLAKHLRRQFPALEFVRHLDIALPRGRKSDPAGFPWDAWKGAL